MPLCVSEGFCNQCCKVLATMLFNARYSSTFSWHLGLCLTGLSIESLPKILCLQLLRFVFDVQTMRRKKLSDTVALPLALDLAFLCPTCSTGICIYELAAVCLHSGTAHGGHYHAFTRDPHSGIWRDANDTRVQVLGPSQCSSLFLPKPMGELFMVFVFPVSWSL